MKIGPSRLAALLLLAAMVSCTKNDSSIEIFAVCAFPEDATKCESVGKCDRFLLGRPAVATAIAPGTPAMGPFQNDLTLIVQVNNQLPNNADKSTYRVNTNDFTVEEYRLSYSSNPPIAIPGFSVRTNLIVPAAGTAAPFVPLIPWEVMAAIDAADPVYSDPSGAITTAGAIVDVELKLFGHTRDGREIESAPWVLPVQVFDGIAFDPVCVGTGEVLKDVCPHIGQSGTFACGTP